LIFPPRRPSAGWSSGVQPVASRRSLALATAARRSPLEQHEWWLLDLVTAEPDLTLDEIGARLASAKKLKVGRTSIWRFYDRHRITFKKNTARRRTGSA
jgi:transposase